MAPPQPKRGAQVLELDAKLSRNLLDLLALKGDLAHPLAIVSEADALDDLALAVKWLEEALGRIGAGEWAA